MMEAPPVKKSLGKEIGDGLERGARTGLQTMERVGAGIEDGIDEGCSRFFSVRLMALSTSQSRIALTARTAVPHLARVDRASPQRGVCQCHPLLVYVTAWADTHSSVLPQLPAVQLFRFS